MSMISEIATETTIKVIAAEIAKALEESKDKPDVCDALKKIGRFSLTQFEWTTPDWAKEYKQLFKEVKENERG